MSAASLLAALIAATPGAAAAPGDAQTSTAAEPFTDAQLDWLERMRDQLREELAGGAPGPAAAGPATAPQSALELKAEAYIKWLYRNNTTQGCVTYGNPHPRGDNYSGDNGACPEFALTITGRPSPRLEASFRLQSRFGQDFADWFENGDKRERPDASAESLGNNHSAPIQLRGIYVRVNQPLPLIDWFHAGSSDLGYWDPWTVGKVRFIDRFNAKGLFLKGHAGDVLDILLARIAMSKLFGTANYNDLEEPLLTNPFWARDAVYAAQLATGRGFADGFSLVVNGGLSLDEEAEAGDPDAPGSVNVVDPRDQITAVAARFLGVNGSLTLNVTRWDWLVVKALFAISHNAPDARYVTNLSRGGLGFSNIVYDTLTDVAGTVRVELPNLLGEGFSLKAEYFNIGADFNAVAGARREADVLLTDGFMDGGQVPTLNVANELIDFSDVFYESCIGWHGATLLLDEASDLVDASLEGTLVEYNTDLQGRDMDVYPGFGGFTGYTDADLFSYANTNDRGRDPRTVYARDQARRSFIFVLKGALKPGWWAGARIEAKAKLIFDRDLRNASTDRDDYDGALLFGRIAVRGKPLDELDVAGGFAVDYWSETGRSGTYAGGEPSFADYKTTKLKPYVELRYSIGALSAQYHLEMLKKTVDTATPGQPLDTGLIWRSIGYLAAQF